MTDEQVWYKRQFGIHLDKFYKIYYIFFCLLSRAVYSFKKMTFLGNNTCIACYLLLIIVDIDY